MQTDDELWSAIAGPSRRQVLDLLVSNGEVSASWLAGRVPFSRQAVSKHIGRMHLVCYLRDGDRVFETYRTTLRGVETMDYSYALMDLTVYGRQESWEDSPPGWPQRCTNTRTDPGPPDWPPVPAWPAGRPIPQWSRLEAGRSDDLAAGS